jgi:hypothetical protein
MLLLRRALFALGSAGYEATLLAPSAPAAALVGPGPADVCSVLAWEAADVAALLSDAPRPGPLADRLAGFDAALAFTRNGALVASLRTRVPRLAQRDPEPGPGIHASAWLAQSAEELGIPATSEAPALEPTAHESAAAAHLLERLPHGFLSLHPGSGAPRKNWPAERFAAVASALSGRRPWLLVEGEADREAVEAVRQRAPGAIVAKGLPPRVLGALLSRAGLFIGNDSGVSHLAAAFGAPTLALFGPTDPAVWAPVGPRTKALRASEGRLEALETGTVLLAASALSRN